MPGSSVSPLHPLVTSALVFFFYFKETFIFIYLFYVLDLAMHGMGNLSSPTRDCTHASCLGHVES